MSDSKYCSILNATRPKILSKVSKDFWCPKMSISKKIILVGQNAGCKYMVKELHGCRICITYIHCFKSRSLPETEREKMPLLV